MKTFIKGKKNIQNDNFKVIKKNKLSKIKGGSGETIASVVIP